MKSKTHCRTCTLLKNRGIPIRPINVKLGKAKALKTIAKKE